MERLPYEMALVPPPPEVLEAPKCLNYRRTARRDSQGSMAYDPQCSVTDSLTACFGCRDLCPIPQSFTLKRGKE